MLLTSMDRSTFELAGLAVSMVALPSKLVNAPRTVVTIAWRAEKPRRVCVASSA